MTTLTFKVYDADGNLADADDVPVLSDKTGTYGIKRNDTGATIIAANTVLTKSATVFSTGNAGPIHSMDKDCV